MLMLSKVFNPNVLAGNGLLWSQNNIPEKPNQLRSLSSISIEISLNIVVILILIYEVAKMRV